MQVLDNFFGLENVISFEISEFRGRCYLRWPPHSPDLSPLDFWAWSRLKSLSVKKTANGFYKDRAELMRCVTETWNEITPEELYEACVNGVKHRLAMCIAVRGHNVRNYSHKRHAQYLPYDRHA